MNVCVDRLRKTVAPLSVLLAGVLVLAATVCPAQPATTAPCTQSDIDALVTQMTLAEKVGQLNMLSGCWDMTGPVPEQGDARQQYLAIRNGHVGAMLNVTGAKATKAAQRFAVEESRLGIPLLFGYDVIHGYRTMFPLPLAESCSWDLDLMRRTARAAATEAAQAGLHWTFAPMVDISRDARWGRVMEGAGEDPWLGAQIAVARVRGFQGDDLAASDTLAACAKHFAAYGFVESGREYNTVDISRHTLFNVVMPPFLACSRADVASVMTAFNDVAGVPATADRELLQGLLRDNWAFEGMVLSDWASCRQLLNHGVAANPSEAAQQCIAAGCDMDMEGRVYSSNLAQLVASGAVPVKLVDDSVRRILKLKMKLGLFEDPYRYCDSNATDPSRQHLELAQEAARESIVMLHNRKRLLPMKTDIKSVAVIGPLADDKDSPLGNWRARAEANSAVSVLEAVQQEFGPRMDVRHAAGCQLLNPTVERGFALKTSVNETNLDGIEEAAELAAAADLVLLVVGEDCYQSGEARSRTRIGLPGVQPQLVQAVTKANPNTVLLVMSGRPLVLTDEVSRVGTALQVWHLGSQAGLGIVDVLTGRHNPSGKLTTSLPRSVGQLPIYYNHKNTGRPIAQDLNEVWYSHFGDELNEPLYPFGHGVSYTEFRYQNLRIDRDRFSPGETVTVSLEVSNVGDRAGTEIVQLYVRDLVASRTRPVRELKAFRRVFLEANEQQQLDVQLDQSAFGFYDDSGRYVVEPGEFHIFVGGSSQASLSVTCFVERLDTSALGN